MSSFKQTNQNTNSIHLHPGDEPSGGNDFVLAAGGSDYEYINTFQ